MAKLTLRRGRRAVTTAFKAHDELRRGRLEDASKSLSTVRMDGTKLAKEAQDLIMRMEAVEFHYRDKEAAISRRVAQFKEQERRLRERKTSIESELDRKTFELSRQRSSLRETERDLARARREQEEEKKKKERMIAASVVVGVGGLLFSVATVGLGTPFAAAAVAGCALSASDHADKQKAAERNIQKSKGVITQIQSAIKTCNEQIPPIQREIQNLTQRIEEQMQEASRYHDERGDIKRMIAFVKEAQVYWSKFADATKHGTNRTELVQKLTKEVQEKRFFQFFARRQDNRHVVSFLEAWEDIQEMVKGGSEHLFQMEFQCSHCSQLISCHCLPHAYNRRLVCRSCYYEHYF